jgi:PGF-pre-PGF domain-containing protein
MMKISRVLIFLPIIIVFLLSSLLIPVSHVTPARADVTWTKYSGEVTLDGEQYVGDASVIKDGSTYRMWYTHGKTDLGAVGIVSALTSAIPESIISKIASLALVQFLEKLSTANVSQLRDMLDGSSTVIGYATSTDGVDWTAQKSEVEGLASDGSAWNSVGSPTIIKDSGTYKMWYTRLKTDLTQESLEDILVRLGTAGQRKDALLDLMDSVCTVIGYATSTDGKVWTEVNTEALPGGGTAWSSVSAPSVIKVSSTYKMWYTSIKTDVTAETLDGMDAATFGIDELADILDGTSTVIGYATSTNGSNWTVQNSEALAGSGSVLESVATPSVIKGNNYEMWYTRGRTDLTQGDFQTIISEATSLVGDFWDILQAFTAGDIETLLNDLASLDISTIEDLLGNTNTVIAYATSTNGNNWTVQRSQHLVGSSSGAWSSVGAPTVIKSADNYKIWYTEGIDSLSLANILALLLGTDLPIGYAYYTPTVAPSGAAGGGAEEEAAEEVTPEDISEMSTGDAADTLEGLETGDAADIVEGLETDKAADIIEVVETDKAADVIEVVETDKAADIVEKVTTKKAADIIEKVTTQKATDIIEKVTTKKAADIIETVTTKKATDIIEKVTTKKGADIIKTVAKKTATSIMEEVSTGKLNEMMPDIGEETLVNTLPDVSVDKLLSLSSDTLFESLPSVPVAHITGEFPPTPPPGFEGLPVVRYATDTGERAVAILTPERGWVTVIGTPAPIQKIMIKTNKSLKDVVTTIELLEERPADILKALPADQIVRTYMNVSFENATPADIDLGHFSFYLEKSWLEANNVHKWSVTLYRYNPELNRWVAKPTKRVSEDTTKAYYTATSTHFSTFAIAGSEKMPAQVFEVTNLSISAAEVSSGNDITISADVRNTSSSAETFAATLWLNDTVEAGQDVDFEAGQSKTVSFTVTTTAEGTYKVRIERLTGSFNVTEAVVKPPPAPTPAAFTTSALTISPGEVDIGQDVTISVMVANTGELSGSYEVALKLDGVVVDTKHVTLAGGASEQVTFTTAKDAAGTYTVNINGLSGTFTVKAPVAPVKPGPNWWLIGGIIVAVIIIAAAVWLVLKRRRD